MTYQSNFRKEVSYGDFNVRRGLNDELISPFQLLNHEDLFLGPDSKCLKLVNYISMRT